MGLELKSSAFSEEEFIPEKYTCQGDDISPPLSWSGAPEGTSSFVLICDDPDAPAGTWDHWLIYNIPEERDSLEEDIAPEKEVQEMNQGLNDFDNIGYGGPCPPPGPSHRYVFTLYALDEELDLEPGLTKEELLESIESNILEKTELVGKFSR